MFCNPETEKNQAELAEVYLLVEPGDWIEKSDRERWVAAKRGGAIIDDRSLAYPNRRGHKAFDISAVKFVFRRSNLIIIAPEREPAHSLWHQSIEAGGKATVVATHFDRCASWALQWRRPETTVVSWLPEPQIQETDRRLVSVTLRSPTQRIH
jgi:hypothetical protein